MVGAANAESAPGPTESSPKVGSSGDIETVDPLAKLVNIPIHDAYCLSQCKEIRGIRWPLPNSNGA